MKHSGRILFAIILLFFGCFNLCAQAQSAGLYDAVDPLIGTSARGFTFPGASLPFGMIQWSPDTNSKGFYVYEQKSIRGFSLTHLSGVGCPIYADVPVLPWTGAFEVSPAKDPNLYVVPFDHSTEEAHPGYYSIKLGNGVKVELTVAERAGIARFRFPEGHHPRLLVNAGASADTNVHLKVRPGGQREMDGSQVELTGNNGLRGTVTAGGFCSSASRYTIYFAAAFNQPFQQFATWQEDAIHNGERTAQGKRTGAWLDFGTRREVEMKVGISYVSEANALDNLSREIPGWNFDGQRTKARKSWTKLLNKVEIAGGTPDQRKIFATGLYHMLLDPTLFSDENGEYIGFDWKTHSVAGSKQKAQYANYSDWDIYRNTVQFQALLDADRESDIAQSLVNDAEQSGRLPGWPVANEATHIMVGDSPPVILSEIYAFGARKFDTSTALKYMVKAASVPDRDVPYDVSYNENIERPYLNDYLKLGYIPASDPFSCTRTLEYVSDDFAIAQFARSLGDKSDYLRFLKQSENWRNLFDPETRWIRPRQFDGSWVAGFDPELSLPKQSYSLKKIEPLGFQEGNTYQYTFMIPFDYPQLFRRIGSNGEVQARLDKLFSQLRCGMDKPCFMGKDEADLVIPYAYAFLGMPWKTEEVTARIEKDLFKTTPDGIPGNDDLGAMSGEYVWDALGFYPAVPGVGGLVLGAPMFHGATLHFSDGRILVIRGEGTGPYVQSVTMNGAPFPSTWLPFSTLKPGRSLLVFTLSTQPNRERGKAQSDRPPSFTD
jgi:predicted alpha-1,2-mannosidase